MSRTTFEVTPHFAYWDRYWGELFRDDDPRFPTILYGFDSACEENAGRAGEEVAIPAVGACYGYVEIGAVAVRAAGGTGRDLTVEGEMYFSTANGAHLCFLVPGRVVVVQAVGFRGLGWCMTPSGRYALSPGRIFHIPRDGRHRFATENGASMDVIAYHPDSDFGPTHEEHPMVNRTWVGGRKIDNSTGRHAQAHVVPGRDGVEVPDSYWPGR